MRGTRRYSEVALRMLCTSTIGTILLLLRPSDISVAVLGALVILTIDIRNPVSLKNFFLVYVFLLFGVGAGFMHLSAVRVIVDAIFYIGAFVLGYAISSASRSRMMAAGRHEGQADAIRKPRPRPLKQASILRAIAAIAALNLMLLLFEISRYGVVGYYQGQQLADQFLTYGKANPAGGVEQIIRFGLNYTAIALAVLYAQECIESSRRIRYRYPLGLLIVLPILSLHRFDAVVGAATVVGIYSCERRVSDAAHSQVGSRRPRRRRRRSGVRGAVVVLGIVVTFGAALVIGSLRNGLGAFPGSQAPSIGTSGLITEEFTPVQAYGDIKANLRILGRPHGRTIVLPLIFKVIPRAWLPDKPLNSGAYYMSIVHPAEFAAGFALPPTFFGDALLSFGFVGALIVFLILGAITARVDMGYKESRRSRIPLFLIGFANYYSLMRFPISESLAGILLTLLVWGVANHVLRPRASVNRGSAAVQERSVLQEARGEARSMRGAR